MSFLSFWRTSAVKTLFALFLLAFLADLAPAATYYVSTSGNDSSPGTQAAPFRHVSLGAAVAHAGDTVIVMNGTYDNEGQVADSSGGGSVVTMGNSGTAGNPITIKAQNRGGAILNAASSVQSSLGCSSAWAYFDLSYTSYVVIQGFVIENACINGIRANGSAHDVTIRWNEIRNIGNWNNPAGTLSPSGIYLNSSEYNFTFDGNIFHDIGGGANVNQQHAIYTHSSNVTIINNIFYNQVHGWDIQTAGGNGVYISNNTFAFPNPGRDGQIVLWDNGVAGSLANVLIQNNIFYQPLNSAITSYLAGPINGCTFQYNLTTSGSIWDNGSSCTVSSNVTNSDPKLVNPAGHDFHLQAGSPAIDTGMNNSYTIVDFEGTGRPVNRVYDRGSYEYHSSSSPTGISLSANPKAVSVAQGSSVTDAVTLSISGSSATVNFSVGGLPSGVTGSFSPSSCSASCTATLTLRAGASYQGTATISIVGNAAGGTWATTPLALTVTPASVGSGDYTSGLAAEWKLLGGAIDSVHGDNGSLHGGASWVTGNLNGASLPLLSLDGVSGYVSANEESQLEMTNQLTVAFWMYPVASPTQDSAQRIVAKVYDWDVKMNGVYPQFSAAGKYAMTSYAPPLNAWAHVVFTFNSGAVNAYVNGHSVSFAENTFTSGIILPTYQYGLYLGTDSSLSYFYSGRLSDVRIYNRVLSAADVSALYSAGATAIQ